VNYASIVLAPNLNHIIQNSLKTHQIYIPNIFQTNLIFDSQSNEKNRIDDKLV